MPNTNAAPSRPLPPAIVAAVVSGVVTIAISIAWTVIQPPPQATATANARMDNDALAELVRVEVAAALYEHDLARTGHAVPNADAKAGARLHNAPTDPVRDNPVRSANGGDSSFEALVAEAVERELERRARRARQIEVDEMADDFKRLFEDIDPYQPDQTTIARLQAELTRIGADYADGRVTDFSTTLRDATRDLREALIGSLDVGDDEVECWWMSGPVLQATRYGPPVTVGAPLSTRWHRSDAIIHAVRLERDGVYTAWVQSDRLTLRLESEDAGSLDRPIRTASRTFVTGWLEAGDYQLIVQPSAASDPFDVTLGVTERQPPVVVLGQPIAVDIEAHWDAVFEYTVDSDDPLVLELLGIEHYELQMLDEDNEAITPLTGSSHHWPAGRWVIRITNLSDRSAHGSLTVNLGRDD